MFGMVPGFELTQNYVYKVEPDILKRFCVDSEKTASKNLGSTIVLKRVSKKQYFQRL